MKDFNDDYIDAELQGFYDYVQEMSKLDVYNIIDIKRLDEFKHSLREITKIVKKESPDAKIEYKVFDKELNVGIGTITIETDEFVAKDIKQFISSIQYATNLEFYPLTNGNIKIGISFYGMTKAMPK